MEEGGGGSDGDRVGKGGRGATGAQVGRESGDYQRGGEGIFPPLRHLPLVGSSPEGWRVLTYGAASLCML